MNTFNSFTRLALVATAFGCLLASTGLAAVSNDREYKFGEGAGENGSNNATLGSGHSISGAGDTLDDIGPSGAFLDLVQSGDVKYVDVFGGSKARAGTSSGDLGAIFDGNDDRLVGIPLNRPDELSDLTGGGYPINYTDITARGLQGWVYPDAAAIGSEGSPTTYQSIVFDTIFSGGPAITADGKWTQSNSFHVDGASGVGGVPASVDVAAGDTWYHIMHHNYLASDPSGASIVPGSGAGRPFTSVLYVDGIAVSANNDNVNTGGDGSFVGQLVVGAAETNGDGLVAEYSNYFTGVVDNLDMYVYGDNSSSGGQNYGTFDLFADNEWIANEIANTVPGGVLIPGDVNMDGAVNGDGTGSAATDDVRAFVDGWGTENTLDGAHNTIRVGDWSTWGSGDMNHDGIVNLLDWHFIKSNHPTPALLDLGALLSGTSVPEPTSAAILLIGIAGGTLVRRRQA